MSSEYDSDVEGLTSFGENLCSLLRATLVPMGIHSVTFRVKKEPSALQKLSNHPEAYSKFSDLHDLLGIRIITNLPDDVDKASRAVRREFDVDSARSVDKRQTLEPDQFGYLSVHHVAKLGTNRSKLGEYAPFADRVFEIQIRSILQHAWAEIEHDLGYKGTNALAPELRRRFSRLSGLLEIADAEFESLRQEIQRYERKAKKSIAKPTTRMTLDSTTCIELLATEPFLAVDRSISHTLNVQLSPTIQEEYAARLVQTLRAVGVTGVEEVRTVTESRAAELPKVAQAWFKPSANREGPMPRGLGLMMLCHLLASESIPSSVGPYADLYGFSRTGMQARLRDLHANLHNPTDPEL